MATLFTAGADTVDFNLLTPDQKQAIAEAANLYDGLGGNDVVTLPNIANYNQDIGNGLTLGWMNSADLPFSTGSKVGNTYTVTLGDGQYFIRAGAGTDVITVNGKGSGTITAGSGSENLTISGGGSLTVNHTFNGMASIGAESTLELRGSVPLASTSVKFAGADGTLKLDLFSGVFAGTIGNLSLGDTIDLAPFFLSRATGDIINTVAHTKITGTTLTVTMKSGKTLTLQLGGVAGDYSGKAFTVANLPLVGDQKRGDFGLRFANASPSINTNVPGSGYGNPYIDSLIWGAGKWNGGPITYWFGQPADFTSAAVVHGETEDLNSKSTLDSWTSAQETAFKRAFDEFAAVCGLTFQLANSAATANIDLWLSPPIEENSKTLGVFEVPSQRLDGQEWGVFNDRNPSFANLQTGGDGLFTIVHELGHGMGLAHPHDGGFEPDNTRFPGVDGQFSIGDNGQNQGVFTVMSYVPGWNGARSAKPLEYGGMSSPGAFDIAALQQLYGKNNSFRPGDDTYTLPNENGAGTGWSCIWDTGGNNTISNAGSDTSCIIDLRAAPLKEGPNAGGFISHDLGISGGFTIANGVIMNGAIGGSGNDLTIGNNTVSDNVDGGDGFNIFQIVGARADFTVTGDRASATVVAKAGGITDNLTNVDAVAFAPTPVHIPGTNGNDALHVTGDGLVVVAPLTAAAAIEGGATLQLFDSDTGNVTFKTGAQESLVLDKSTAFAGHAVGFGASDRIDLVDIPFVNGSMIKTYTPLADPLAGGTLTIDNQAGQTADIKFKGSKLPDVPYTAASFNISNDGRGGTLITDPPVDSQPHTIANGSTLELAGAATAKTTFAGPTGSLQLDSSQAFSGKIAGFGGQDVIDLGDIAFGANTTLGYRENASNTGGTLNVSDGIHSARIALLGNYMASSFATAGDGHGGTLITEASTAAANLQPLITVPHA